MFDKENINDKEKAIKRCAIIVAIIMLITAWLFKAKFPSIYFYSFSLILTLFIIFLEIFSIFENKKRKKKGETEIPPLIGIILLFVPVFMTVGCSILNSAFAGETALNQKILGFFLCIYSIIFLFLSGTHLWWIFNKTDKLYTKSQEDLDKSNKQLIDLSTSQRAEHDEQNGKIDSLSCNVDDIKKMTHHVQVNITESDQKLMRSIEKVFEGTIKHLHESLIEQNDEISSGMSYIESMLDRLALSHGFTYTAKQITDLDTAKLSLGNKAWKAQQVKQYFDIMGVQNKQEISKIKGIKIISKTQGKKSVEYCPKSVEKYVMSDVTQTRQIILKKAK